MSLMKKLGKEKEAGGDGENHYPKLVDFEAKYRLEEETESILKRVKNAAKRSIFSCNMKQWFLGFFPIINTIRTYNVKEYLPSDITAGLVTGITMIPQGMAFAVLATLPPIVGLYISLFSSIVYIFLGTGKQMSWGNVAVWSLMLAEILDKYDNSPEGKAFVTNLINNYESNGNMNSTTVTNNTTGSVFISNFANNTLDPAIYDEITTRRIEVAGSVSVAAGLILILLSRVGFSRISAVMSNSIISGFMVGIAFHVATSQLKGLLGLTLPRFKGPGMLIRTWISLIIHIPETNIAVFVISLISIIIIYLVKRFVNERYQHRLKVPIPIEIIVVIIATIISYFGSFSSEYGVTIVEEVPVGLPLPKAPDFPVIMDYIGDAMVIVVLSYAQSLALAKTMGLKHNYEVDANQEMLATGACTVVCGLFSGYITGGSVAQSIVQDGAGAKSQVASFVAASLVFLVIMVIGTYFYFLPTCVLSAIIIVNLKGVFLKLLLIPGEWRKSKYDCCVFVFVCVATVVLNPDMGLLAGVVFSLFLVVLRSMVNPVEEIGQISTDSTVQFRSLQHYPSVQKQQAVKIIRIKTSLYFLNIDSFNSAVYEKTGINPIKVKEEQNEANLRMNEVPKSKYNVEDGEAPEHQQLLNLKTLIFDMSEVAFVDTMGVTALELLILGYTSIGIEVLMVSVPESIFGMLQSTGFWKKQQDRLFVSVDAALSSVQDYI